MENSKKWYFSTTLWFNVALALTTLIQQIAVDVPLPPEFMGYVAIVGNILLRFKTSQSLIK